MSHHPAQPFARLTVPAEPVSLALARHAVAGPLRCLDAGQEVVDDLKLVLSEVCKNAIEHGYGGEPGTIEIEFCIYPGEFEATVRDHGRGGRWATHGTGSSVLASLTTRHRVEQPASGGTLVTFARRV